MHESVHKHISIVTDSMLNGLSASINENHKRWQDVARQRPLQSKFTDNSIHCFTSGVLRPFPHQENGSSVNRLGLAEFKSASVLSLRSSTLTRGTFQHNGGSELKLLALWHCEQGNSSARSASTEVQVWIEPPFMTSVCRFERMH